MRERSSNLIRMFVVTLMEHLFRVQRICCDFIKKVFRMKRGAWPSVIALISNEFFESLEV